MRFFQRLAATLAATLALAAQAVSISTDFSDLWYNSPAESERGWGANIIQQRDVLFVTLFVYAANGNPTWYVAPATVYNGVTQDGTISFTGPLFETSGSYFGGPFSSAATTSRQVGFLSFAAGQISNGALSYTVDGVSVTKSVIRQTWRAENLQGIYVGASLAGYSAACAGESYRESSATITVQHAGLSNITVKEETPTYTCTYVGAYSQLGRMGQISATGSCTDGTTPTFQATEVMGGLESISMRFSNTFANGCFSVGRMGGVRRGS